MSTKIYNAWKTVLCNEDPFRIAADLHTKALAAAKEKLLDILLIAAARLQPGSTPLSDYGEMEPERETQVRTFLASIEMEKAYRKQLSDHYRSMEDLSVYIGMRSMSGYIYLIPYGDMQMSHVWDFLGSVSYLKNYAYWNNTDEPEDVTREEWEARGDEWDETFKLPWLRLDVISPESISTIMSNLLIDNELLIKSRYPTYAKRERWGKAANGLASRPGITKERFTRWFPRLMAGSNSPGIGTAGAEWIWDTIQESKAKNAEKNHSPDTLPS